jgi:hypothetical protein
MLCCGIDLHSNNSVVVISDENDKVLYSKRHPNSLEEKNGDRFIFQLGTNKEASRAFF